MYQFIYLSYFQPIYLPTTSQVIGFPKNCLLEQTTDNVNSNVVEAFFISYP